MKALIVYESRTGTTKEYAENIEDFLRDRNIETQLRSVSEYRESDIEGVDIVLLGCWTHGLMIMFQHPTKEWVEFAKKLPSLDQKKFGLFTTYLIATGRMFRKMNKHISAQAALKLRSKNGELSDADRAMLLEFLK